MVGKATEQFSNAVKLLINLLSIFTSGLKNSIEVYVALGAK